MKKLLISTVALATCLTVNVSAGEFKPSQKNVETDICMKAISGNRASFYNTVKSSGYSMKHVIENVKCNDKDLLVFVEKYGKNADAFIRTYSPKNTKTSITEIAMNK